MNIKILHFFDCFKQKLKLFDSKYDGIKRKANFYYPKTIKLKRTCKDNAEIL